MKIVELFSQWCSKMVLFWLSRALFRVTKVQNFRYFNVFSSLTDYFKTEFTILWLFTLMPIFRDKIHFSNVLTSFKVSCIKKLCVPFWHVVAHINLFKFSNSLALSFIFHRILTSDMNPEMAVNCDINSNSNMIIFLVKGHNIVYFYHLVVTETGYQKKRICLLYQYCLSLSISLLKY